MFRLSFHTQLIIYKKRQKCWSHVQKDFGPHQHNYYRKFKTLKLKKKMWTTMVETNGNTETQEDGINRVLGSD